MADNPRINFNLNVGSTGASANPQANAADNEIARADSTFQAFQQAEASGYVTGGNRWKEVYQNSLANFAEAEIARSEMMARPSEPFSSRGSEPYGFTRETLPENMLAVPVGTPQFLPVLYNNPISQVIPASVPTGNSFGSNALVPYDPSLFFGNRAAFGPENPFAGREAFGPNPARDIYGNINNYIPLSDSERNARDDRAYQEWSSASSTQETRRANEEYRRQQEEIDFKFKESYRSGTVEEYLRGSERTGSGVSLRDYITQGYQAQQDIKYRLTGNSQYAPRSDEEVSGLYNQWLEETGGSSPFGPYVSQESRWNTGTFMGRVGSGLSQLGPFGVASLAWHTFSGAEQALSPYLKGQSYLPEQMASETGSSLMPMFGAILGAGLTKSPMGAIVGGEAGASTERLYDELVESRLFGPRRDAQALAGGSGSQAVEEFTNALRNAATPAVKELSETLVKLGGVTTTLQSGGAVETASGWGRLQFGLGTGFESNVDTMTKFLSNTPELATVLSNIGKQGANVAPGTFEALAGTAAISGDVAAVRSFMNSELASENHTERASFGDYMSPLGAKGFTTNTPFIDFFRRAPEVLSSVWTGITGGTYTVGPSKERQNQIETQSTLLQNLAVQANQTEGTLAEQGTTLTGEELGLQAQLLSGRGSAAYRNALPGLTETTSRMESTIRSQISNINRIIANTPSSQSDVIAREVEQRQNLENRLLSLNMRTQYEIPRQEFEMGFQERQAGLTQDVASAGVGYSRALYSGGDIESIYSSTQGIISGEMAQMNYLRSTASGENPASPAERAQMRTQASQIQAQILQRRYQASMQRAGYGVSMAGLGVQSAELAAGLASMTGSPEEIYQSLLAESPAISSEITALNSQISVANTLDRPQLLRQRAQLEYQNRILPITAADTGYSTATGIVQSQLMGASSNLGVSLATYGSGSQSDVSFAAMQSAYQSQILAANTAIGRYSEAGVSESDPRIVSMRAAIAQGQAGVFNTSISSSQFTPSPELSARVTTAQGELTRMGYGFAMPGNYQDIVQENLGLVGQELSGLRSREAQFRRQYAGRPELRAMEAQWAVQEQSLLNQEAQLGYESDMMFGRNLPTMSIGGSSFTARALPSRAQLAMGLESQRPEVAARITGYYDRMSGASAMAGGSGYLAPGHSAATAMPGNFSMSELANAIANALNGITINVNNGSGVKPSPARITSTARNTSSSAPSSIPGWNR